MIANTVAVALIAGLTFLVGHSIHGWFTLDHGMVVHRLKDEVTRLAATTFFDKMTALVQLAVALLGAGWALLTMNEPRVHIHGFAAVASFAVATAALVFSVVVYSYGYDLIISRMFHYGAFDIGAPVIRFVSSKQQWLFLFGCLALAATIVLGRRER